MFVSLSFGAMVKHVICAGVGGFVTGVGTVLLYQKIKNCSTGTAAILVSAENKVKVSGKERGVIYSVEPSEEKTLVS